MVWKRDDHTFSAPEKDEIDVHRFFRPLVQCMTGLGMLDGSAKSGKSSSCKKTGWTLFSGCRTVYLTAVWAWTILMSVNIFYMSVSVKDHADVQDNSTTIQKGNMVITLLEQMPFAVLAIRSALILTLFLIHSQQVVQGIDACEAVRQHINCLLGGRVTFDRFKHRPLIFILSAFSMIILFEIYEWSVWFNTDDGMYFVWDFRPFPFKLLQLYYGCLWWAFTTIPFLLSQTALCVPVLFAYVLRRFSRFVNKELHRLARRASAEHADTEMDVIADRVTRLRTAHFQISQLTAQLDESVNRMLLVQFVCDICILFGFLGLLVNSKDTVNNVDPSLSITTLEWTFYIPASLIWFFFFLFYFSFPLIHLACEGERTHAFVHSLTFSSQTLFQRKFKDLSIFLSETTYYTGTPLSFTGGHFYHINRHYVVTCFALAVSYLTVLTEILDRYYGTEDIKAHVINLTQFIKNSSTTIQHH